MPTREDTDMKLTGKLKEQVEKAETKEEKKALIENAGMELNDEELEKVYELLIEQMYEEDED